MNILSAIILSLSILFGTAQATTESPEVAQVSVASQEVTVTDTEAQVLANDAQVTWTDYMTVPQVGEDVAYVWVMTTDQEPDELPADMVVLQSLDLDHTWHVYQAQILYKA